MLDAALHKAHGYAPEFGGGLSNHAPMVMEVMEALGQKARIPDWLEHYKDQLEPLPSPHTPSGKPKLGDPSQTQPWLDHWRAELGRSEWKETLRRALPTLLPGVSASAAHGVLRVAHATRSLERKESRERIEELAHGLAYWSSTFARLPGDPVGDGEKTPFEALQDLRQVPAEARSEEGLIQPRLQVLEHFPDFLSVINQVRSRDPLFLDQLTETFARIFLNHTGSHAIVFLHAFTGPSALRLLFSYLEHEDRIRALKFAWQMAAAIYATHGDTTSLETRAREDAAVPDRQELVEKALHGGAAHAIKMTEACLREWALNPKPVFLFAARHAIETIAF